jgi:D-lactate dehydrogenase (cytochrome)
MLEALIGELRQILGPGAVVTDADALRTYDADASMLVAHAPQIVVLPASAAQAAAAVRLAVAAGLPVVARGAGTGIAGGAVPVRGGVVLSTARMDAIEAIDLRSRRATVGPGVVNAELNGRLAPLGMQFAPDPSSQRASTIGGNLATNAGGPHCLKYGVTTNHILAVELARADGTLLWTGDGVQDAAGYDLTGLVVGSEGTFGLVTSAMVRLTPLPEANRVVLALFPSVVAASAAVSLIIGAGMLPTSLEVMDHNAIRAVNGAYGLGLPEADGTTLLIVEVDGVEEGLDEALEAILTICRAQGAFDLRPARTPAEQARVWTARKSVAGAIGRLAPAYLLVDTVVPRTRLPLMMEQIERLRRQHALEVCNVFHAGDGNLHPLVLYDPRDLGQVDRAHAFARAVLALSIEQGGVISGEHGIGLEKQEYLPLLFSRHELQLQATIHQIFNPGDHFNPAKLFPAATSPAALAAERRARIRHNRQRRQEEKRTEERAAPDSPDELRSAMAQLLGADSVIETGQGLLVAPATIEELSQVMAACHRAGSPVYPTSAAHAERPAVAYPPATIISTRHLTRVLTYEPDDLTIGVEAGMSLETLQAILERNQQMLPLDLHAPGERSIGALVADGAEGPRRLGYGTLRDWALALTVVEADGTVVRLGAQVVKNVTGYDLVKLFVGSRGTLGVIAAVSLKVFPRPQSAATAVAGFPDQAAAFAALDALAASRLQPTAAEYLAGWSVDGEGNAVAGAEGAGVFLATRAEGHPAAVERHMRDLAALAADHGATLSLELRGAAERRLWSALAAHGAPRAGADEALVRLAVPAAELGAALNDAAAQADAHGLRVALSARALNGMALLRARGEHDGLRAFFAGLGARWRNVHLLAAGPAIASGAARWGWALPAAELMGAIKHELDPYATMNPEAFVV